MNAYTRTTNKTDHVDDALAADYNSLRAEARAAGLLMSLHNLSAAITYGGGSGSDLPSQIEWTDPEGDGTDVDAVQTITYDGQDRVDQVVTVFSALNVTVAEVLTYTGDDLTGYAVSVAEGE